MAVLMPHPRRRYGRAAVTLLLLGAVVYGIVSAAGQLGAAFHTVLAADAGRVVLAAGSETASYIFLAAVLLRLASDPALCRADAFRVGLISSGLGTILPAAPVEGMVLAAQELEAKGLSRRRTFVAVGLAQWYFARALFAVGAVAALTVAAFETVHSSAPGTSLPVLVSGGVALGVGFVVMGVLATRAGLVEWVGRVAQRLPLVRARAQQFSASCRSWGREIHTAVGARENRLRLFALALAATVADGACFVLALRAANVHAATTLLVLAYAVAMLAAFAPLLPAGIGVVETAVPSFLHHAHVPIVTALAGVLVYRALATLMPAFVGAGVLGEFRLRRLKRRPCEKKRP